MFNNNNCNNNDNNIIIIFHIYAKKLLDFQNVNYIFKDIYAISLSEYRQTVKNNEIYNYDEMRNESMSSTSNVIVYNRKSKL